MQTPVPSAQGVLKLTKISVDFCKKFIFLFNVFLQYKQDYPHVLLLKGMETFLEDDSADCIY